MQPIKQNYRGQDEARVLVCVKDVQPSERGSIMLSVIFGIAIVALLIFIAPRIFEGDYAKLSEVSVREEALSAAYDTQRIAHLKQFQTGLELYFVDTGAYPLTGGNAVVISSDEEPCLSLVLGGYISACHQDPTGEAEYIYSSDGETFTIETKMVDSEITSKQ